MDPMVKRETVRELGFHLVVDYKIVNIRECIPTMFESTSFILNMATFRSPGQKVKLLVGCIRKIPLNSKELRE